MLTIPATITQGVTVETSGTLADYPASTHTLRLVLVVDGQQTIINATADGDVYTLTIAKTVSAEMASGSHHWQTFATNIATTERFQVGEGELLVKVDFEAATGGYDGRSALRIQVDAIRALLSGVSTDDQKKVKYADREIERYDRSELIVVYGFLKSQLAQEERAVAVSQGKTFGGRVRVRMA
jgi:hypothetical protein